MYEIQLELEETLAKNNLMDRLLDYVDSIGEIEDYLHPAPARVFLAHMVYRKKVHITSMVGMLRRFFDDAQQVANTIQQYLDVGYATFDQHTDYLHTVIDLPTEIRQELDLFQYPLPMLIEPRKVTKNTHSGYLSIKKGVLANGTSSEDLCLDHINRVNAIPLSFNKDVSNSLKIVWKSLLRPKQGETTKERNDKKYALERFNRDSMFVMDIMSSYSDKFYMTHGYDSRGRYYCRGYHVNPQGTDWHKATVEFHEKHLIQD